MPQQENDAERPIFIVDALNLFMRAYMAHPDMSSHGYQVGGLVGFIKTLRRLVNEFKPSAVYICWESGGSSKRRAIFKEYKLGRRPENLNRFYAQDEIPDTEQNRTDQIKSLLDVLKCFPVCQLYVSECEGDDLVAYLCRSVFRDRKKIIVSSDKDLYQLIDEKTVTYSLHKKTFVTRETVMTDFRVQSKHFGIAKALCGDAGDNVPGIKGLGFKTVAKLFPFLGLEEDVVLQDVISYANSHIDKGNMYRRVVQETDNVRRNWRLVYLDGSMIPPNQMQRLDQQVANFKPKTDLVNFIKLLIREGVNELNASDFLSAFWYLQAS